ncbi:hypothetical protein ACFQ68_40120 [Amycolatopsis japonica]|uniref:hypothetical protein n=1 Tax=Amycolatopsis japonica TaxID=208439 RepID=UPI00366B703F
MSDKRRDLWTSPTDLADAVRASGRELWPALAGCGAFALLAWLAADTGTWESKAGLALAALMALSALWELGFLVRAAFRFADHFTTTETTD